MSRLATSLTGLLLVLLGAGVIAVGVKGIYNIHALLYVAAAGLAFYGVFRVLDAIFRRTVPVQGDAVDGLQPWSLGESLGVGMDVLRPPAGDDFTTRQWRVLDQALPVPFLLGSSTIQQTAFLPSVDTLGGTMGQSRQFSSFRAYHDAGNFDPSQTITDSRLIGRSVWNTDWMLIIPGGTLLANPNAGLDTFISSVKDVKLFFQTYSYSGN